MVLQTIFMIFYDFYEDLKLVARQKHRIGMKFEYQYWRSQG